MMKSSPLSACLSSLALVLTVAWPAVSQAQTSVLNLGSGTIDWFDANNWSNGVANGAGHVAQIQLGPDAVGAATIGSPVTLEQLLVSGRGTANLPGVGPLNFANDGSGELLLRLIPDAGNLNVVIGAPLVWATNELLRVEIGLQGTLNLNGTIAASGDLLKSGAGVLRLSAANAAWSGDLDIAGGVVIAGHAQALGTAAGLTTIRSGGRLVVEHSTAESLQLDGGVVQLANKDLTGPITLAGSSTIFRPRNPVVSDPRGGFQFEQTLGATNVNGVISGAGNLTIDNQSRDPLFLRGDNTHTGHTYVSAGAVYATSSTAFGSAAEGTTINGGTLIVSVATAEPMYVNGGTLNFATASSAAGPLTLRKGAVNLPSGVDYTQAITLDQATNASIAGSGRLAGGIVGTGDVTLKGNLSVNGAPIANDGDLIIASGSQKTLLETPNSFTGDLILLSGEAVIENLQAASRPVKINGGKLTVNRSDMNFTPEIRVTRGSVENFGEISGAVILEQTTGPVGLTGGRFTGVISGKGDVGFSGREGNIQTISGQNTFDGIASVGYGVVNADSSTAFGTTGWATVVENGILNVNVATNEKFYVNRQGTLNLNAAVPQLPRMLVDSYYDQGVQQVAVNVPSSFTGPAEAASGRLLINANASVESLQVRDEARVIVASGATLDVAGGIELQEGRVEGSVTGAPFIRKTTFAGAHLANMPQFTGQVIVEQGILEVYPGGLGTAAGSTRVASGAQLMTRGIGVIADDIYLEDAVGPMNRGGLFLGGVCCNGTTTTIKGRLDLGTKGSIIGADGNGSYGTVRLDGGVQGGSLTTWGSGVAVRLTSQNNLYTGVTDVRQGYVVLSASGRLEHTSRIAVHEGGVLMIDNSEGGANLDRIDARVPIEFYGGELSAYGGGGEAFGTLRFMEGQVRMSTYDMTFSANRIERQAGATLSLELMSPMAVSETPANFSGLLPWMTVVAASAPNGPYYPVFGEFVDGHIRPLGQGSIMTNLNAATASSNVGVAAHVNSALTADRTVNSLLIERDGILDLAGHTITVESGGVIAWGGEIRNGNITAGASQELILHTGANVNANIVDGQNGPIDVTFSEGTYGGNNTFSGRMFVNQVSRPSTARFTNENAIPDGVDVSILGGSLTTDYAPTRVKELGKLHITGGGTFSGNGRFSFEEALLENGAIQVNQLAGDAPIRKTTIASASISQSSWTDASYTGQITVDEGILSVQGLPGAAYVVNGGRLQLVEAANAVQLNGGEFEFLKHSGPIAVNAPSTLIARREFNAATALLNGPLSGAGELTFNSDIQYFDTSLSGNGQFSVGRNNPDFTGDVRIQAADVAVHHNQALGSGNVTIYAGGSLRLGYDSGNPGVDLANQITLDGGLLRGFYRSRHTGDLHVVSPSYVGNLNFAGSVYLANGVPLTTYDEETTRFLGQLHVGADAQLVLGRVEGYRRGLVEIGGTIVADETASVLNLIRGGLDDYLFTASLHVQSGRSLELQLDGEPMKLSLGAGQTISGGGLVANELEFGPGAVISPGSSPGVLTLSDVTIGGGAEYEWEFNNLGGLAGGPVGWDLLNVEGSLTFAATAANPWIFNVDALPQVGPLTPLGSHASWLIADVDAIIGFDPAAITIAKPTPGSGPSGRYFITQSGSQLFLNVNVPEPSAFTLTALAAIAVGRARRRQPARA